MDRRDEPGMEGLRKKKIELELVVVGMGARFSLTVRVVWIGGYHVGRHVEICIRVSDQRGDDEQENENEDDRVTAHRRRIVRTRCIRGCPSYRAL